MKTQPIKIIKTCPKLRIADKENFELLRCSLTQNFYHHQFQHARQIEIISHNAAIRELHMTPSNWELGLLSF